MTFKKLFLIELCFVFIAATSLLAFNYFGFRIFHIVALIFFCAGLFMFLFGYILKLTGGLKK